MSFDLQQPQQSLNLGIFISESGEIEPTPTKKRLAKANAKKKLGTSSAMTSQPWVQLERKVLLGMHKLFDKNATAAKVLNLLLGYMQDKNAVVISQQNIARILNRTDRTIRSAIAFLVKEKLIEVHRINGNGAVCAYVVNSRVGWSGSRERICEAVFSANVVTFNVDQEKIETGTLRKISTLFTND